MLKKGLLSKEAYDYLYDGRTLRNKSSYDYSLVFSEELAEELILQAEKFIDEVEQLLWFFLIILLKFVVVLLYFYNVTHMILYGLLLTGHEYYVFFFLFYFVCKEG